VFRPKLFVLNHLARSVFSMNKVVIVSYAFPPVGGVGVQRATKFVKYLRHFDWEPIVLTVANPSAPLVDVALLQDIPEGVKILRTITFEPSYAQKKNYSETKDSSGLNFKPLMKKIFSGLLLPDIQILWWPGLICKLISVIRSEKPQCIFVTAPPFSSFIPVVAIGSLFKIPVVADFRDEWNFSREQWENSAKNRVARHLDRVFEKYVVSKCAIVTAATKSYIDSLVFKYNLPSSKCFVITNGYDESDFQLKEMPKSAINDEKNIILYAGTAWNGSSLKFFFSALKEIDAIDHGLFNRFRIQLYGRIVDSELDHLKQQNLGNLVELNGFVQHEEIVKTMIQASILLLVISDFPGAEKIIVAKTFEYMATGKHIFAIVPEGETKRLLSEQYDNVTFAHPGDLSDIKNQVIKIVSSIDQIVSVRGKYVSQFSRKSLTGQLADVLNKITFK